MADKYLCDCLFCMSYPFSALLNSFNPIALRMAKTLLKVKGAAGVLFHWEKKV